MQKVPFWRKILRKFLKINRTKYSKISKSRTFFPNFSKISKVSKSRMSGSQGIGTPTHNDLPYNTNAMLSGGPTIWLGPSKNFWKIYTSKQPERALEKEDFFD